MVADYYEATGNKTFLDEMMPWMDQEMRWWMINRTVNVNLPSGSNYVMYQYRVSMRCLVLSFWQSSIVRRKGKQYGRGKASVQLMSYSLKKFSEFEHESLLLLLSLGA